MKRLGKFLFITSLLLCFLIPRGWTQTQAKNQPDSIELKLKEIYTKREVMIPMRDGIKLYTAVYEPKDNSRQHPILMHRSPYSCSPYGEGFDRHFRTNLKNYIEHRYIIVFQDVRGRHKSEGIFIQVRPLNKNKKGKKDKKNIDIIRKTKCFDFWERNVLFPKTKRSFFRTPTPLPCPFPLNFSLLIITKKFGNLAKNRYICIV